MQTRKRTQMKRNRRLKQVNHCISKELVEMGYDINYVGNWSKKSTLADTGSNKADKKINRIV